MYIPIFVGAVISELLFGIFMRTLYVFFMRIPTSYIWILTKSLFSKLISSTSSYYVSEKYTEKMFQMLNSAYSIISVEEVAKFLGMSEDKATNCTYLNLSGYLNLLLSCPFD